MTTTVGTERSDGRAEPPVAALPEETTGADVTTATPEAAQAHAEAQRAAEHAGTAVEDVKGGVERAVEDVKGGVEDAAEQAEAAEAHTERALQAALREAGYATLGVGDAIVDFVRDLGHVMAALPERLKETPEALADFFEQAAQNVRQGYEELSERGRELATSIRERPAVREAVEAVEVAEETAEAAGRQVAASTEEAVEAVETAGEATGDAAAAVGEAAEATAETVAATPEERAKARTAELLETRRAELEAMTVIELREVARDHEIPHYYELRKADLIDAIVIAEEAATAEAVGTGDA